MDSSFPPNPGTTDNYLTGGFGAPFNHSDDPIPANGYDLLEALFRTGNVVYPSPASPHFPSMMNTWNDIRDDTHQAGAYGQNDHQDEKSFASSSQQGGSSGVDQNVGQAQIDASTFLISLSPGSEPTIEQMNIMIELGRRVMRNELSTYHLPSLGFLP